MELKEIEKYWDNNIDKFQDIINKVEYQRKGIWYTEAFLFCSICDLLGVETIIESGIAKGCSTDIFASYFNFNIISIDNNSYGWLENTKNRLSHHKNLTIIKGNSGEKIPKIISKQPQNKKIGIFIDGPKGKSARSLRDSLIKYNNILCFGFHDYKYEKLGIGKFKKSFITHEIDFITKKYSYLNEKVIKTVPKQSKHVNGPGVCVEVRV